MTANAGPQREQIDSLRLMMSNYPHAEVGFTVKRETGANANGDGWTTAHEQDTPATQGEGVFVAN